MSLSVSVSVIVSRLHRREAVDHRVQVDPLGERRALEAARELLDDVLARLGVGGDRLVRLDGLGDAAATVGEAAGEAGEAIVEFAGEAGDFIMDGADEVGDFIMDLF